MTGTMLYSAAPCVNPLHCEPDARELRPRNFEARTLEDSSGTGVSAKCLGLIRREF